MTAAASQPASATSTTTAAPAAQPAAAAPGKQTTSSTLPPEAVAELTQHAGETFLDGGSYVWRVETDGSFTCVGQPPSATVDSKNAHVTKVNRPTLWAKLSAMALEQLPPVAKPDAAPAAAAPEATPAPADTGWSLEGFLDELFAAGQALVDIGSQVADLVVGASTEPAAVPTPEAAVPTPEPKDPPPDAGEPDAQPDAEIHAMSQFIWYGADYSDLHAADVANASKVLAGVFGLGTAAEVVTSPAPEVSANSKNNPNRGYWWFKADGSPTWSAGSRSKAGTYTGTQYVLYPLVHSDPRFHTVAQYLAAKPPGARDGYMKQTGSTIAFGPAAADGFTAIPDAANLNLRNLPGGYSCFETAEAMLGQAGMTEVANGDKDEIRGVVTGATYYDAANRHGSKYAKDVTVNAAQSLKAKMYVEWQTLQGKPVMAGVRYDDSGYNSGNADHFLLISGRQGDGAYTFDDPASSSTAEASKPAYVFTWQSDMLACEFPVDTRDAAEAGFKRYVVSYIRPNKETLQAWTEYWAKHDRAAAT